MKLSTQLITLPYCKGGNIVDVLYKSRKPICIESIKSENKSKFILTANGLILCPMMQHVSANLIYEYMRLSDIDIPEGITFVKNDINSSYIMKVDTNKLILAVEPESYETDKYTLYEFNYYKNDEDE